MELPRPHENPENNDYERPAPTDEYTSVADEVAVPAITSDEIAEPADIFGLRVPAGAEITEIEIKQDDQPDVHLGMVDLIETITTLGYDTHHATRIMSALQGSYLAVQTDLFDKDSRLSLRTLSDQMDQISDVSRIGPTYKQLLAKVLNHHLPPEMAEDADSLTVHEVKQRLTNAGARPGTALFLERVMSKNGSLIRNITGNELMAINEDGEKNISVAGLAAFITLLRDAADAAELLLPPKEKE